TGAPPVHARGEGLCESRMREIRTSGSTRGEERCPPPLLLYRPMVKVVGPRVQGGLPGAPT
ncbi:MAG: hypothetical protein ABSH01_27770, partial [Terriglobia bacterium]